MSGRVKVAFGCHLLVILGIGIIGLIYLFRTEFMPYHAVAVGHSWKEVDSAFQILLLALIRAFGQFFYGCCYGYYSFCTIQTRHSMGTLVYSCNWLRILRACSHCDSICYAKHACHTAMEIYSNEHGCSAYWVNIVSRIR